MGFINARVYAFFKPLRLYEGFVVFNDKVIYTGNNTDVVQLTRDLGGNVIDLKGKTVLPGFIDAHLHLDSLGLSLVTLDLRGVKSIDELKKKLKLYSESSSFKWIIGRGWDQELFIDKRYPTKLDLDEVVKDRPVILIRTCGHVAVLNTVALELTGLAAYDKKEVEKDTCGNPTGLIYEEAVQIASRKFMESITINELTELLKKAQYYLISHGITTVGFVSCSLKSLKALLEMWVRGELKIRVRLYVNPFDNELNLVELLRSIGLKRGFGDEYLKIMGLKLFADGSLGARTAWLTQPYEDDQSTNGYPAFEPDNLRKISKLSDELGLQLAIHAIGDKAIETVLSIYRELKNIKHLRHRIEHVSVLRDDELEEFSKLGAVAVVQPHFVISDWWADRRLGSKRIRWLYRFRSMIDNGIPVAFSTDAPVEPVNPWETIYAAVTRGKYDNIAFYDDIKHESINVIDALHSYTYGSAYAIHEENVLGSLLPGSYADFVVVDRDPLETPDHQLKNIKILETYIGGIKVYSNE
ncbi:MAG: amidohydrolase [Desulfurococcaceae archaeon]